MGWSILAFMSSGARNGLTAVPPVSDSDQYTVDSTNYMKFTDRKILSAWSQKTAAIANFVSGKLKKVGDVNGYHTDLVLDQTGVPIDQQLMVVMKELAPNDRLGYEADNGNNAQYVAALLLVGDRPVELVEWRELARAFPGKIQIVRYTGSTAAVAATWTKTSLSTDHIFDPSKRYMVVGMAGNSATMYAARIVIPGLTDRPGVPGGDTAQLQRPWLWKNGPVFPGSNPPEYAEVLCSSTDAAQDITLVVVEV